MWLFDLFKKKSNLVDNRVTKVPANSESNTPPAPEYVKTEVVAKTPSAEITTELDSPPPLEELLRQATPSKGDLYPHEILMLDYAHTYKTSDNSFQGFWYYQYSVKDPQSILNSLCERGFIEPGDLRSVLEHLKLGEIKDELKLLNEKISGKKAELIDRLLSVADHNELFAKYPERFFKLTSKGEQELKENQYVPYLHRHRYMSVWEMNRRLAQIHYPYRDVLWGYFNEQSSIHVQNYDFGLYRNLRYFMYEFLLEENKPKTALELLAEAAYYDLSLMGNSMGDFFANKKDDFYWHLYERKLEHIAPYSHSFCSSSLAYNFKGLQETLDLSDDELRSELSSAFANFSIPELFRVFTDDECVDILMALMKQDETFLENLYDKASERKYMEYKKIRDE